MKKIYKNMSLLLAFFLMICCIPSSVAFDTSESLTETLSVLDTGDGIYQISNDAFSAYANNSAITVHSVESTDVYFGSEVGYLMRIDENRLMEAEYISIDPYSFDELEHVSNEYSISELAYSDIYDCITKVKNKEVTPTGDIRLCIPRSTLSNGHTYRGYKNETYYEEFTFYALSSIEFNYKVPSQYTIWDYLNHVLTTTARTAMNGLISLQFKPWKVISLFVPNELPSSTIKTTPANTQTAKLHENKTRKYTWLVKNGEYFIGSVLDDTTDYRFQFFVTIPGQRTYDSGMSPSASIRPDNYLDGDKLAYENYLNGGYKNTIDTYVLEDKDAGLSVLVDALA